MLCNGFLSLSFFLFFCMNHELAEIIYRRIYNNKEKKIISAYFGFLQFEVCFETRFETKYCNASASMGY